MLEGIRERELDASPKALRSERCLESAYPRAVDGQGEEDVRVVEGIVIEEIADAVVEVVQVQGPVPDGDREPDLVLRVPLAVEGKEAEALLQGEVQDRTR